MNFCYQLFSKRILDTTNLFSSKKFSKKNFLTTLKSEYNYNIFLKGSDRAKRVINNEDRFAIIQKPLGLILEELEDGMVAISEINPTGNAAKSNFEINVGDIVVGVSATFGDEIWSTRGIGLDRVMKSIKTRSGDFVTLILENPEETEKKKVQAGDYAAQRRLDAREKFGKPILLDPITLTPINDFTDKEKKSNNFFKIF